MNMTNLNENNRNYQKCAGLYCLSTLRFFSGGYVQGVGGCPPGLGVSGRGGPVRQGLDDAAWRESGARDFGLLTGRRQ